MHKYTAARKAQNDKILVSIVGARGYSGLETARLILQHPYAQLANCFATTSFSLSKYLSHTQAENIECFADGEVMNRAATVVFLATPAEVSLKLAPQLVESGRTVIDLSGAFRLKKNNYKKWYGFEHTDNVNLTAARYGLCPWIGPAGGEKLVANPGCYATAITMALIPLLKGQVISTESLVIDAKSGTSGAGRKAAENLNFTEVEGECLPYKVGRHQHYPEIQETIEQFAGVSIEAHMATSLLPVRRGIIAGIYAQLNSGMSLADVKAAFDHAYSGYPLVSHNKISENSSLLSLKRVVGTARTHISYESEGSRLYVFSRLDNLLKGAAGQAVENFNRIFDFPVQMGLSQLEAMT